MVPRTRLTPRRLAKVAVRTRSLDLFDELAAEADRAVAFRLFGERSWLLTDPAACRAALTAPPELVTRSATYRKMSSLLGHSLLTTDGREHRRRRRLVQPVFTAQHIGDYAPAMVASAEATAQLWREGDVIDVEREMAALTLGAIGTAVLGLDGRAHARRIGLALDRLQRAIALLLLPGADTLLRKRVRVLRPLLAASDELRAVAADGAASSAPLVDALRQPRDGEVLDESDLVDELLTMLLAGHETTAMTLSWAWWWLDREPRVADRMRAELTSVLRARPVTYADLSALPYTTAVIAETLRLRPPAWIIERQVIAPCDIAGLEPPVGTVLLISPWVLHRDPTSWRESHRFLPERWLDASGEFDDTAPGQPRGAWLPFGAGSHVCVGASFAWAEAVLVLATLARVWHPVAVAPSVRMRATATLRPADPIRMRVGHVDSPA